MIEHNKLYVIQVGRTLAWVESPLQKSIGERFCKCLAVNPHKKLVSAPGMTTLDGVNYFPEIFMNILPVNTEMS